jgi:hypothetical protein
MGDRIVRVEALVEHLAKQVANAGDGSKVDTDSFASIEDGAPHTSSTTPGTSDGVEAARSVTTHKHSSVSLPCWSNLQ